MGRPGGKGGGRAETGSKSLRKGKPPQKGKSSNLLEPKRVIVNSAIVVLIIVILLLGWRDGGASEGATGDRAEITEWSITVLAADGSERVLCTHSETCRLDPLWEARTAGLECRADARLWLASRDNPMIITGARLAEANVTATAGLVDWDGQGVNYTTYGAAPEVHWSGGWWWRAFSERADVSFRIPCDAWTFQVVLEMEGRAWTGGAWAGRQVASQVVHTEMQLTHVDAGNAAG